MVKYSTDLHVESSCYNYYKVADLSYQCMGLPKTHVETGNQGALCRDLQHTYTHDAAWLALRHIRAWLIQQSRHAIKMANEKGMRLRKPDTEVMTDQIPWQHALLEQHET